MRLAEGDFNRLPQWAKELDALNPRVFVTVVLCSRSTGFARNTAGFYRCCCGPHRVGLGRKLFHPGEITLARHKRGRWRRDHCQIAHRTFKQLVPILRRLGMVASNPNRSPAVLAMKDKEALQKIAPQLGFNFVHYGFENLDGFQDTFAAGLRDDVSAFYISGIANLSRVMLSLCFRKANYRGPYPEWGAPNF